MRKFVVAAFAVIIALFMLFEGPVSALSIRPAKEVYITVAWELPDGWTPGVNGDPIENHASIWPQKHVASVETGNKEKLHALDGQLTECGKTYQVDVYHYWGKYKGLVDTQIASGYLDSPSGQPDDSGWHPTPGLGSGWKFKVNGPCLPEPEPSVFNPVFELDCDGLTFSHSEFFKPGMGVAAMEYVLSVNGESGERTPLAADEVVTFLFDSNEVSNHVHLTIFGTYENNFSHQLGQRQGATEGCVPDVPGEPEIPDNPDNPEEPEVPETPEVPEVPEVPSPEVPEAPETPETPELPGPAKATILFECVNPTGVKVTWDIDGDVDFVNGYSPEPRPLDGSDWIVAPGASILVETVLNNIGVSAIDTAIDCAEKVEVETAPIVAEPDPPVPPATLPVTGSSPSTLLWTAVALVGAGTGLRVVRRFVA